MRFALLFTILLTAAGCTHLTEEAVDALVARRLFCASTDVMTFIYVPGNPAVSDTPQTIGQIRTFNAARETVCPPASSEQPAVSSDDRDRR